MRWRPCAAAAGQPDRAVALMISGDVAERGKLTGEVAVGDEHAWLIGGAGFRLRAQPAPAGGLLERLTDTASRLARLQPCNGPIGVESDDDASGPLAHVTGTCSRSNRPFRANVGAPWLRYLPIASWQAAHPFRGGAARAAFIIAGSNLPSTAVNFPAARSAATWSARTANEAGGVGELPATLLLLLPQAGKKHTTASDPSAAIQRFMAQALPRSSSEPCAPGWSGTVLTRVSSKSGRGEKNALEAGRQSSHTAAAPASQAATNSTAMP